MTAPAHAAMLADMTDQLTALDATFLELEQMDEGATMHIGGIMVFDPLPKGGVPTLEAVRSKIVSRLTRLPRYTQRLSAERTGGLTWPTWEPDPRFDLANHVQRAALPKPGGDAELCAWAGDFFSHRLDRTRPLWEMVLVEGLEGGRWALASKTHHALVDGVGSVDVVRLLLEREPRRARAASAAGAEEEQAPGGGQVPGPLRAMAELARSGARAASGSVHAALHPRDTLERSRALAELIVRDELMASPGTSLNVPIGATREYAVVRAPLAETKAIAHALGGSVNDIMLAACTTGLARLLVSRREAPPHEGLRAMVPMNVRRASEELALGNRISSLFVDLPVAEVDSFARVRTIIERTSKLKASGAALGAATMLDLAALAPPVLHATVAHSLYATRLFNLTITNVPGPRAELSALGAPLREVFPLVPLAASHTVAIATFSYAGQLVLGVNADRDSTPDLRVLVDGIEEGFAELGAMVGEDAQSSSGTISMAPQGHSAAHKPQPLQKSKSIA